MNNLDISQLLWSVQGCETMSSDALKWSTTACNCRLGSSTLLKTAGQCTEIRWAKLWTVWNKDLNWTCQMCFKTMEGTKSSSEGKCVTYAYNTAVWACSADLAFCLRATVVFYMDDNQETATRNGNCCVWHVKYSLSSPHLQQSVEIYCSIISSHQSVGW
jgi:hypothetical protein